MYAPDFTDFAEITGGGKDMERTRVVWKWKHERSLDSRVVSSQSLFSTLEIEMVWVDPCSCHSLDANRGNLLIFVSFFSSLSELFSDFFGFSLEFFDFCFFL